MDVDEAQDFLWMLGCRKISVGARWVKGNCPLGYRHRGGADKTPSFGISIDPKDHSNCRCLACMFSGDPLTLLWRMAMDGKAIKPEWIDFAVTHNQWNVERLGVDEDGNDLTPAKGTSIKVPAAGVMERLARLQYSPFPTKEKKFPDRFQPKQSRVPEDLLQKMIYAMPAEVLAYLMRAPDAANNIEGRNLRGSTIEAWELGWHPGQRRICIPIRDVDGNLVGVSGRSYDADAKGPKYLHTTGFKRDLVLYGEHKIDKNVRVGYLFEGFFHVMAAWQCGFTNSLARLGTHLSRVQLEKLVSWFDRLIIVPDGDEPGRNSADTLSWALSSRIVVQVIPMPEGKDADSILPEQLIALLRPTVALDNLVQAM